MRTKVETQEPCDGNPFSARDFPQARTAPATTADAQYEYTLSPSDPHRQELEQKLDAILAEHPPARESEAQPSERTLPGEAGASEQHKLKPWQERAQIAVLAYHALFGGFLTINLGPDEDPDDAIKRWRDFVENECGRRPDHYSIFVNLTHTNGKRNPHLHIIVKCQPGDAIFEACARYAHYYDKRSVLAGGKPILFKQTDPARGGVCGLLRYFHSRRNGAPARLARGAATIHRSQGVAALGRTLTKADIAEGRQRLAFFRCDKLPRPQPANVPARLNQAQTDAHPQPVYVTT